MKPWVKFLFILSLFVNVLLIADIIMVAFNHRPHYSYLENSTGLWGISRKGAGKLLRYAMKKDPELLDNLTKMRIQRSEIAYKLAQEPFNKKAASDTFTQMRAQTMTAQQKLHTIFIEYMAAAPPAERHELILHFLGKFNPPPQEIAVKLQSGVIVWNIFLNPTMIMTMTMTMTMMMMMMIKSSL